MSALVTALLLFTGCADSSKQQLTTGYADLAAGNYDQASAAANAYLQANPEGRGAAEAWYLLGRSYEDRNPKPTQADADRDLQEARNDYIHALDLRPNPNLEGRVREGIGNVAYFQNDFTTAAEQYGASYRLLDRDTDKAWALYRSGLSLQRLGRFEDADRTFATVLQDYPGTEQANRAHEKTGARAFYVRLATFANIQQANAAVATLKKDGILADHIADPVATGQTVFILQAGPYQRFMDAHATQQRLSAVYPGALIVP